MDERNAARRESGRGGRRALSIDSFNFFDKFSSDDGQTGPAPGRRPRSSRACPARPHEPSFALAFASVPFDPLGTLAPLRQKRSAATSSERTRVVREPPRRRVGVVSLGGSSRTARRRATTRQRGSPLRRLFRRGPSLEALPLEPRSSISRLQRSNRSIATKGLSSSLGRARSWISTEHGSPPPRLRRVYPLERRELALLHGVDAVLGAARHGDLEVVLGVAPLRVDPRDVQIGAHLERARRRHRAQAAPDAEALVHEEREGEVRARVLAEGDARERRGRTASPRRTARARRRTWSGARVLSVSHARFRS